MAKKLVPSEFKTHLINQIIESVTESANTSYYAFVGDHETVASTLEEVNAPTETFRNTNTEVYRNMIFGKRINASDISFMVNRHDWTSGTIYQMYDDQKIDLQNSNFYVVVNEDSFKHVYKCLYNANGAPSTSQPQFENARYDADLFTSGDDYYETSDGYQWKYMYSIPSTTFNKFATENYIPVVSNTAVESNAAEGAIDVIKVETHGKNYNNCVFSTFAASDLNRITRGLIEGDVQGDFTGASHLDTDKAAQCYRIKLGSEQTTDFYKNTRIYISSGTGVGQHRRIEKSVYVSEIGGVVIQLETQFDILPDQTSVYEITPDVLIVGDGTQTVNATARAIVNAAASNSIHKIEVLDTGADYSFATAEIIVGNPAEENGVAIIPQEATIRPVLSPQGGHGANTIVEFGGKRLAFYMKFERDEDGLTEPTNTFAQFGIVRDPKYANVAIYTTNKSGSFSTNEQITQFTKLRIGDAAGFKSNTALGASLQDIGSSATTAQYDIHFEAGDYIFIETDEIVKRYLLTTVASGSTANTINLTETPYWVTASGVNCTAYYVHDQARGIVKNISAPIPVGSPVGTTGILVDHADPEFRKDRMIYGAVSRNIATIEGVDINNRIGSHDADFIFQDFTQVLNISGPASVGDFIEDETVTQGDATGQVHSAVTDGGETTLTLTNVTGRFLPTGTILGQVSRAEMTGSDTDAIDILYGDLDPNTGAILYLQNDIPVDRDENQTEEIRVILEF